MADSDIDKKEVQPEYLHLFSGDEEINSFKFLQSAMKARDGKAIESAAKKFTMDVFGVPADDLDRLPPIPEWMKKGDLSDDETFDDGTVVVVIPQRNLVTKHPKSGSFAEVVIPQEKGVWYRFRVDDKGVLTTGASELISDLRFDTIGRSTKDYSQN